MPRAKPAPANGAPEPPTAPEPAERVPQLGDIVRFWEHPALVSQRGDGPEATPALPLVGVGASQNYAVSHVPWAGATP